MNLFQSSHRTDHLGHPPLLDRPANRRQEAFSTAIFTGLNIAVFLILAASVVGAAVIYSGGA